MFAIRKPCVVNGQRYTPPSNKGRRALQPGYALQFASLLALLFFATSCNYPGAPESNEALISAWIDAPLHNSIHAIGPIDVIAHGAAYGQLSQLELSITAAKSTTNILVGSKAPDSTHVKAGTDGQSAAVLGQTKWVWTPSTPGLYTLLVRAQKSDGTWSEFAEADVQIVFPDLPIGGLTEPQTLDGPQIAATPSATVTSTATPTPLTEVTCTDQASFIADITIPDDTSLAPGAAFLKTWRLRNTGTCTWDENYKIVFVSGDPMSNATPLSMPSIVPPGGNIDISLNLIAPSSNGTYKSNYQIRNPQGVQFGVGSNGGVPFYVQIVVGTSPTAAPQGDTQAPNISVSHNPPGSPREAGKPITLNASASDNVGVARIEIYVQVGPGRGELVKTCTNTSSCSYQNSYSAGTTIIYSARAYDAAGNQSLTPNQSVSFIVVVQ